MEFAETFGAAGYRRSLEQASSLVDTPLSLYVHLPFCQSRCSFCACHVVTTKRSSVADAYLERLIAEATLVARLLGERTQLDQYHWGGGTPTYYSPEDLVKLHRALLENFVLAPNAEVAIEVDPRVTTNRHLRTLRGLGFNRLSMGVQDLDPRVQRLIGRDQSATETISLFESARALGFESINVDLIFGLPGQTTASFDRTLGQVLELRPDRLAVYSFAYLPNLRPNQKRIDETFLPDQLTKLDLLTAAVKALVTDGYVQIGMDHFALPNDDLSLARANGTLSRNFMGYTAKRSSDVVALGTSGIGDVQGAYAQNHKRLASYYESVDRSELPVERGVLLSEDDLIRRHVITELMCNGRVNTSAVEKRFGIAFFDYFSAELDAMHEPGGVVAEGLLVTTDDGLSATSLGELFIRNIAMAFDAYLEAGTGGPRRTFSRTV